MLGARLPRPHRTDGGHAFKWEAAQTKVNQVVPRNGCGPSRGVSMQRKPGSHHAGAPRPGRDLWLFRAEKTLQRMVPWGGGAGTRCRGRSRGGRDTVSATWKAAHGAPSHRSSVLVPSQGVSGRQSCASALTRSGEFSGEQDDPETWGSVETGKVVLEQSRVHRRTQEATHSY